MVNLDLEGLEKSINELANDEEFREKFDVLVVLMHAIALKKKWWEPAKSFGEQVVMMHSELSEAIEEYRKVDGEINRIYHSHPVLVEKSTSEQSELFLVTTSKPEGVPIELADTIIRIFDTCERYYIDIFDAIIMKAKYNLTRPDRHGDKKL